MLRTRLFCFKPFLFLTFLLFTNFISGQITGVVVDTVDNTPLEYATVALYSNEDKALLSGVVTNASGVFEIAAIQPGIYDIEASFIGYKTKTILKIEIKTKSKVDLGLIKLTLGNSLNEVIVNSVQSSVVSKIDKQVFDAKVFKNSYGGNAVDVLKNLPSVTVNALGDIKVRGSSGFNLLLNGKQVQGNTSNLLNQIPANSISHIEVITAPSAKYDPEGKAGIINIITKKKTFEGQFAQINVRGGLPFEERYNNKVYQRHGIDATYNLIKGKWNLSLGANYQRNDLGGLRVGDVFTIIADTLTRLPSIGERSFKQINYSGKFTLDYTPDTANAFSLGFYAGKRNKDRLADIVYFDNHTVSPVEDGNRLRTFQYFNHNLRKRRGDFVLGSFDYAHTFENTSKIQTSFLYEYTLLGGPTENDNLGYPDTDRVYQNEYNTNDNPLHGVRFQLDYTLKPFSFGTLETGYQYRNLVNNGDFIYQRKNQTSNEFELIPEFSSEVDLDRTIHSGYGQLSGSRNKWEYALGIRLEHMDRNFNLKDRSNTIDSTYVYDYLKWFPSASFQYAINKDTKIKIAYSKRVERTKAFQMNPFPEREHSETLEQGDPTMRPQFIDLVELGFSKKIKAGYSLYAAAYYKSEENVINRVNTVYNDSILNRIYTNVGKAQSFGLEISSQINPTTNLSNFIGLNLYNYKIDGAFDGEKINNEAFIYSINTNTTYRFWETTTLQFSLNYISERNTAQGQDSPFYSPNLTLRKTFLNNQLAATLQWQNMDLGWLKSNEQRITTFKPGHFFTTTNYMYEVDMVILNITYNFNRAKNRSKFIDSEFGKREF